MKWKVFFRITMFLAAMLILGGVATCGASSENSRLCNSCVWLTEDSYWFTEDIDADDISSIRIADFYNHAEWPAMESDGLITDELLNFLSSGCGSSYAKITDDGRYLYFLTEISADFSSGTLCRADLSQLIHNTDGKNNSVIEIDTDVNCDGGIAYMESDTGVYQKQNKDLYYFDGSNTFIIDSKVCYWYKSADSEICFYSTLTDDNTCSLYEVKVGDETSKKEIVSKTNLGWFITSLQQFKNGYFNVIDTDHVFFMTGDDSQADLYVTGYDKKPEQIFHNMDIVGAPYGDYSLDYIYFTLNDEVEKNNSYSELIDISNSKHSETEIDSLINLLTTGDDTEYRPLYYYNFQTQKQIHICDFYDGFSCQVAQGNGMIVCAYLDIETTLEDLQIPVDSILDDIRYDATELESVYEIIEDFINQHVVDLDNFKVPWKCDIISTETGEMISNTELPMEEVGSVLFFDQGKHLLVSDLEDDIYVAEVSDGVISTFTQMEYEDLINIYAGDGNVYEYETDRDLYLGKLYIDLEQDPLSKKYKYSFYEDGSVLFIDDFVDYKYGGTLCFDSGVGEVVKVGDDVTSFVQLQSGTVLYISEQKLVRYSEGKKTRIADDMRLVWSANERKSVSMSELGW